MNQLKETRIEKNITQKVVAERIGISLRSYITYENDSSKENTAKYRFLLHEVSEMDPLDEEHGILTLEDIEFGVTKVLSDYPVEFCYLFGSYAKGKATETSDVDLLIRTTVTGLRFYELAEKLRQTLHKEIDLLDIRQLLNNEELLAEVLKDGVRIYG